MYAYVKKYNGWFREWLAFGTNFGEVVLSGWSLRTNSSIPLVYYGHCGVVTDLIFNCEGNKFFSLDNFGTLLMWDIVQNQANCLSNDIKELEDENDTEHQWTLKFPGTVPENSSSTDNNSENRLLRGRSRGVK